MLIAKLYQNQMEEYWIDEDKDILSSMREWGRDPIGDCGGKGDCGKCKARLVTGGLSPLTEVEKKYLTNQELASGWFLMCQRKPTDNLIIDLPQRDLPWYRMEKKPLPYEGPYSLPVRKVALEFAPIEGLSLQEALLEELQAEAVAGVALPALKQLARLVDAGVMTAVIGDASSGGQVLALEAGDTTNLLYGIAVDIGTCTVGMRLIDLNTREILAGGLCGNSQRAFGSSTADRVAYATREEGGEEVLRNVLVLTLNDLLSGLCAKTGVEQTQIYAAAIAANGVVSHLLLGICPQPQKEIQALRQMPVLSAQELGLDLHPMAKVVLFPNLQKTTGGDTAAALLATRPGRFPGKPNLLIDLGVETELVLLNAANGVISSVSTPALEGMGLQMGMTASSGSITQLEFDEEKQDIAVKWLGDLEAKGLSGMGAVVILAKLRQLGIVLTDGSFAAAAALPEAVAKRLREGGAGKELVIAGYGNRAVVITEQDCRLILQTAEKLSAAIETLLTAGGVQAADCKAVITGAFDNSFPVEAAKAIGLLPAALFDNLTCLPNGAMAGAEQMLLFYRKYRNKNEIMDFAK